MNVLSWQPLPLTAELRNRATAVLDEIAGALETQIGVETRPYVLAELALFFAYLARYSAGERHAELTALCLDRAAGQLGVIPTAAALHGGYVGVAWIDRHVSSLMPGASEEAAESSEIDEELLERLSEPEWHDSFDLISGLAGCGVYFLQHPSDEIARRALSRIGRHLDVMAERTASGVTWFTPTELLSDWQRAVTPEGYYNLGMAHGVPGVVTVLSLIGGQSELLRNAVSGLLACRQPFSTGSYYRAWLPSLDAPAPKKSRTAWCYGDPGPAVALIAASSALDDPELAATGLEILLATCTGSNAERDINDAILCHGTAGLMHLYNRMGQRLNNGALRDAAVLWLERTLEFHVPGKYVGGYARNVPKLEGDRRAAADEWMWEPAAGFLSGTTGIGLALIAALSDDEPAWDRLLLLS